MGGTSTKPAEPAHCPECKQKECQECKQKECQECKQKECPRIQIPYQHPKFTPTIFNFPHKEQCEGDYKLEGYRPGLLNASNACLDEKCEYMVIKKYILNREDFILNKINAIMLKSLQDEKWINSDGEFKRLVPIYHGSWICGKRKNLEDQGTTIISIVVDRWDGDMSQKGINQYKSNKDKNKPTSEHHITYLVYTKDQIQNMFNIARRLDELGIIHGDLTPTVYWYRGNDMVIGNFGFYNTSFRCPKRIPPELRDYYNQWQLSAILRTSPFETWISGIKSDELVRFGGLKLLPLEWETKIESICPEFPAKELKAHKFPNQFDIVATRGRFAGLEMIQPPEGELISFEKLTALDNDLKEGKITEEKFNQDLKQYLSQ